MSIILTEIDIHGSDLNDKGNTSCITPLRSRVDVLQRLEPPRTPKECFVDL